MQKTVAKHRNFAAAEEAERAFYAQLSGHERLAILCELLKQDDQRRLERVYRITQFAPR